MLPRNSGNTKLVFLLCVLALAAVAVLFASNQWPFVDENVSGTIMPAERYQEDQISEEDVVLGDESVAIDMQTDEFEQYSSGQEAAVQGIDAAADNLQRRATADDYSRRATADDGRLARAAAEEAKSSRATADDARRARAAEAADQARNNY